MLTRFSFIVFSAALLLGCSEQDTRKSYLPGNTGNQGELLVVAPTSFWKSNEADTLRSGLLALFPGLPADEPFFNPVEVNKEGFGDIFKTHRNILEFRIDPTNQASAVVREDVYAKQQLQIIVTLNNINELASFVGERLDQILWRFHEAELGRLISRNKAFGDKDFNASVAKKTGLELIFQEDFEIAVEEENFMWLRLDRQKPIGGYQHQINQGILIYSRPYTDTSMFSDISVANWKEYVNAQYVDGPKGSHMSISDRFILPEFNDINFHGQRAKEMRGLWRMDGTPGVFMGGPFYSIAFFHPGNGRQYMVEGYVYGPQFNKRAFLREVEAILKTATPSGLEEGS